MDRIRMIRGGEVPPWKADMINEIALLEKTEDVAEDPAAFQKREEYRNSLVDNGVMKEQADRIAEITPSMEINESVMEDPTLVKAREEYRDTLLETGWAKTRDQADRLAGIGAPLQDELGVG
ncbi:MAG: hypothetical protein WC294_02250 [Methanoregula sp.]|jgi:coenzyme F420-reducing hydrogenase alpha subunit